MNREKLDCYECGHYPTDHKLDVEPLRLTDCRHEIDDGTDKGTIACSCKGWR